MAPSRAAQSASSRERFETACRHTGTLTQLHLFALDMYLNPQGYGEGDAIPTGGLALFSTLLLPYAVFAVSGWIRWRQGDSSSLAAAKAWREGRACMLVAALALWVVSTLGVWTVSGALVERYALPGIVLATLLGTTLFGWMIGRIPDRMRTARWPLVLIVAAICATCTTVFMFQAGLRYRNPGVVVGGSVSEQAHYRSISRNSLTPAFFLAADYINGKLPNDGRLLMLGRGTGYFFTDRNYIADSGGDWIPYIVSEGKTPDGMLRVLHQQGFTYVVYDAQVMHFLTHVYDNHVLARYLPAYLTFQTQTLIPVAQWGSISLYRVP